MVKENKYTAEYFQNLGFSEEEALFFVPSWNRHSPQTDVEVRQDVLTDEDNKEASTTSIIFGNGSKNPEFAGVVGYNFDPETGDFKRCSPRTKRKTFRNLPF